MTEDGVIFHAKHAFMPNSLGYCGPDDRGTILRHLQESKGGEDLVSTLQGFEAAYPFLKLIARETWRKAFDYSVPEAYWIGNSLLDVVKVPEFYRFSHTDLRGKDPAQVRRVFRAVGDGARPHHTFYVMSTFAAPTVKDGQNLLTESSKKVAELVDNCRISWGKVRKVGKDKLAVEYRPVRIEDAKLDLAQPVVRKVGYDRLVRPFGKVREGDFVSIHWGYACDVLSARQVGNIERYTRADIRSANEMLRKKKQ